MALKLEGNPFMQELADEQRSWLSAFDPQYLRNWEKLLASDDEAAMTEADVRRLLQRHGVTVEPNEDLNGDNQSPDFRCLRGDSVFYVEVTKISVEKATEKSGIDTEPGVSAFRPLNDALFEACRRKAKQCGSADGPVLLAIGTWHGFAAMATFEKPMLSMLLTGETRMAWSVDMASGRQVGETYQLTELFSAAFLRPGTTNGVESARTSISGLLFIANGLEGRKPLGLLHHDAVRNFDPALLPDIEFGEVEMDRTSNQLRVHWPNGMED